MSCRCRASIASACWRWRRWRVPKRIRTRSTPPFERPPASVADAHAGAARALRSLRSGHQDFRGFRRRCATAANFASSRAHSRRSPELAETPADARRLVDDLAEQGHRVHRRRRGPAELLRLAGLIALSDPPREDSAQLIAALRDMGVRTVMVTGDSAVTAAAIASKVGIAGAVCPPERFPKS